MRNCLLPILVIFEILSSLNAASGQQVILDTEFVGSEGYHDGDLQFQSITNATEGTWLGHMGAIVDTSGTGTVSRTSDPRRNLFHKGATGGLAGGNGGGESLAMGFDVGDLLEINHVYSFVVNASDRIGLLQTGVRSTYTTGESLPEIGIKLDYLNEESGYLKVFSNLSRTGNESEDDPFALTVNAVDVGINNSFTGGALDYSSVSWFTVNWNFHCLALAV